MSIQTIAVIAALVAIPVASQLERAPAPATAAMPADTGACSLSLQGDQPVLATTITSSAGAADFTITSSSGGMPVVRAMAINTKGTGATNGRSIASGQSCATRPSPGPTLTGTMRGAPPPVATCAMSPDGTASVSVPLTAFGGEAKTFKGHVTLLKRGDDTVAALTRDGWSAPVVVASCTASGARTGYDLAVSKKV